MKNPVFTGAAVAIITPFIDENTIDYDEFKKIIDHQIAHGTDGNHGRIAHLPGG